MIRSPNRSRRGGAPIRLIVLHTAEGARTTAALGTYFARSATRASSHVGIDDQGIEQYVPYDDAAWTLRSGNKISDNAELCGFARWTREQWLGEHRRMLEFAGTWVRERCQARGIPIRKLTPDQVADGQAGVIGHVDWTRGMQDGTHTDPGREFPWDFVIDMAGGATNTPPLPRPTLRRGDTGTLVELVHRFLGVAAPGESGYGTFGPRTERTVRAYQRMRGIPVTGVVDELTWRHIGL